MGCQYLGGADAFDGYSLDLAGRWYLPGRRDGIPDQMGIRRDYRGPGRDWIARTCQPAEDEQAA